MAALPQSHVEEHWNDIVIVGIRTMHDKHAPPKFLDSAEIMLKLLGNILASPTEQKFRVIRLRNEKIRTKLLGCDGARDALAGMGWVTRVEDMEEKMFWERSEADFGRLRLGVEELQKRVTAYRERAAHDPKEREAREREGVMKMIRSDQQERQKREQIARENAARRVGSGDNPEGDEGNTFEHRRVQPRLATSGTTGSAEEGTPNTQ